MRFAEHDADWRVRREAFQVLKLLPQSALNEHAVAIVRISHDNADWVAEKLQILPQDAAAMVRIAQENDDWIVRRVALKVLKTGTLPEDVEHALVPYAAAIADVSKRDPVW